MSKKFRVLINTATTEKNQILEIEQGASYQGKALRIKAIAGDKYQLQEIGKGQSFAPESIKAKRVGKHLHIIFEGSKDADLIIEDYYEVMAKGYNGMVGRAENGNFYEYLTQDPNEDGMIGHLNEGMQAVSQALGGSEVSGAGAAVGVLVAGVNPLMGTLGLAGVGVAAAAAAPGTTTALASTTIGSVTDNEGNPNDASEALVNGGVTNDKTPTLTGKAPAGSVITIKDGSTVLGTTTTDANGNWSFTPATELAEGKRNLTAESTTNGTTNVSAAFAITVDTTAPVGSIGIDAITGDDFLTVSETAGTVTITGTVTGEYKSGDVVTIKVGGAATLYSTTVNAAGKYTMAGVLATELAANTQVVASVLAHDGAWNYTTYTKTRLYTVDNKPDALQTALSLNPVAGDNIITVNKSGMNTTTLAGKATGSFDAGDVVTLSVNDKTFTGTVGANGNYNIDVATADLVADADTKVEARIAATVGSHKQTAVAAQDYVVESSSTAGQQTGLSIDPITVDNIIHSAESNGGTIIEGQVTGAFVINDIVTIMANGNAYTGTADGYGNFRIVVPSAQLVADVNTQVEGRITGTGGSVANAMQNYAVNLNVAPINTLPDAQAIDEDTPLINIGLMVNDADGNLTSTKLSVLKGKLNVTLAGSATISAGSNGTGTLTLSGSQADINATLASLKYTGAGNYNGPDAITVLSTDSQGVTDSDTVAITVKSVNDAPTGTNNTFTVLEDGSKTFADFYFGFSDVDGNALRAVIITTLPTAGTLKLYGTAVAAGQSIAVWNLGGFVYAPAANANGTGFASIGFKVQDNGGTANDGVDTSAVANTLTINVTPVNDAPTGTNAAIAVLEDGSKAFSASDFGFSDVDGNALSAVIITTLPTAGTLKLNGTAVDAGQSIAVANLGDLVFAPAANANGTGYATIGFKVQDNGGTANDGVDTSAVANTLTINVTPVNDAPTGTNAAIAVLEDGSKAFAASDFGFSDVDGNALSAVIITTLPTAGTLKLNGTAFAAGQSIAVADLGNLVFAPAANVNGTGYATIGFKVQDNGGTANGGVDTSAVANTLTINVTAVNDAPTGTNAAIAVLEDGSKTFAASDFGFSDVDGNALSAVIITTLPTAGTLKLNDTAVAAGQSIAVANLGNLVFTPAANANGTGYATIGFKVQDNGGTANDGADTSATANTLTINVTPINDAPTGTSSAIDVLEDGSKTFAASDFGFSDVDGNALSAVIITTLPTAGTLKLNGTAVVAGQSIAVADLGNLVFAPATNANGTGYATIGFKVQDNGGTANGGADTSAAANTLTINVTPVNDAPTGTISAIAVLEDGSKTFAASDFGFSDVDGNALSAVIITTLPTAGTLKLGGTAVATGQSIAVADLGNLVFAPAANANGAGYDTIGFKVQDNGGTANYGVDTSAFANTLTINVTPVNDAPTGTSSAIAVLEDGSKTFAPSDFGFIDVDGNALSAVIITTLPTAGTLKLNGTAVAAGQSIGVANLGNLVFAPAANANGAGYATIGFKVQDNGGTLNGGVDTSAVANTLTIHVTAVNDAPTGGSTRVTILEDGSKNFPALDFSFADGSDSPANALQAVIITTLPTAGTLKLNGTAVTEGQSIAVADLGGLVYAPAANASGEDYASIYFKLQDNGGTVNGGKDTMTGENMFVFDVTAVNDAPVLADTTLALPAVMQDSADPIGAVGSLVSDLVGGATDVDAGAAKGIAITGVANGTLYYSTDGGTSWTAFTDTASDSNALLLGSDADNRIYLKPTAAYSGTANDVTFRAWDQTTGTEGSYVSTETNGGTTAFSSATDTISELVVRAVTINTVSTDNIVAMNEAVPLTGTANPGATVNLTVNSTARSVVADASGNWSYDTKLKPVVRYVMVRKTVDGSAAIDPLSQNAAFDVSEISVMSGGVNVATGKAATYGMGQTTSTTSSAAMTDNNTSTYLEASEEGEQWVQVDLGAYYRIDSITAYSRVDWGLRLNGATIYASGENLAGQTTAQLTTASTTGNVVSYAVTGLSNVLSQASYFSAVPTYSGTSVDAFINGNNAITAAQIVSNLASNASSTVTWRPYDQITITDVVASGATLRMGSGSLVCGLTPTFHGVLVGALANTQTVGILWRLPGEVPTQALQPATVTGTNWSWTVPSGLMSAGTYQIEAQLEDMNLGSTLQTSGTFFITLASTPLVLDLNGDGVQTTSLNEGTQFDLLNTGKKINVGWVSKQDGLLAMDLNGDGSINSGAELFGDHTVLADGTLASNGWVALSAQDSNHDGKIDAQDANFDKLRVWVDANGDGVTDAGELHTLADEHIASINLNHDNSSVQQNGNLVQMASSFTTTDGARHSVADVGFMVQNATSNLFTLTGGNNLDLSGLGNVGMVSAIDMRNDTFANTVKLTLADVMGIATTHGVHVLKLTGDANDSVQLTASEWAHTGTTVSDGAHTYAVYGSTTDVCAQLLIDLDMRY
ncbi:Ig-like domain-containing protein [Limnohabitans planktonicus]|nr:Ig-like domain-containing protein [Limnohabitans planktonicus]